IGDAAVQAGLVGTPMVMIIALTAISEFVIPSLHVPSSFLRMTFILLGAALGLYGIALGICGLFINLCALHNTCLL
ncbi:spore germination protein, partial [Acinetobacter baumannii]